MIFGAMLIAGFINHLSTQEKRVKTSEELPSAAEQTKKSNNHKRIAKKVFSKIKSFVTP